MYLKEEYEPYDEDDDEDYIALQSFKEALRLSEEILSHVEQFAERPDSAKGAAHLSEAVSIYNMLFPLFDRPEYSYQEMARYTETLGYLRGYHRHLLGENEFKPNYLLGRRVEQCLRRLEAQIEELEMIVEYASE